MPIPWLQIVQLVPSIVEVSRELLKRTKRAAPNDTAVPAAPLSDEQLSARLMALEENERRQAELVSQMAEQLSGLTRAITALHRSMLWLLVGLGVTLAVAIVAIFRAG